MTKRRSVPCGNGINLITVARETDATREVTYIATCGACRDWIVRSCYGSYTWQRVADHQRTHEIEKRATA